LLPINHIASRPAKTRKAARKYMVIKLIVSNFEAFKINYFIERNSKASIAVI
jgi:hypothetical protein